MTDPVRLAPDEVHSWCVRLDVPPDTAAGLYATLSEDERNRSARFRFERDQQRFIAAHGVLREILGSYLGTQPNQLRFVHNAFGKPALAPAFGSRLAFNLSHSDDLALIAIGGADIGVDLEHIRAQPDSAAIAERFFTAAEVDYMNRLPSHLQAQAFFSCWTRKEAFVKARGEGFTTDPGPTPVDLHGAWSLYTLHPAPGYIGALAVEGSGWRLSQRHWQIDNGS